MILLLNSTLLDEGTSVIINMRKAFTRSLTINYLSAEQRDWQVTDER